MGKLSPFGASLEGFRLIARRPGALLVWIVVLGVLTAVALGGYYLLGGGAPYRYPSSDPAQAVLRPFLILAVVMPIYLFGAVTVSAAIYRALLDPRAKGLGFVRFSADEGRLFVVALVLSVLFVVADIAITVAIVAIMTALKNTNMGATGGAYLISTVVLALLTVVMFSLPLPTTFAEKKIRIFGGFGRTMGSFWRVLAAFALVFVYMTILYILVFSLQWGVDALLGVPTRLPWGVMIGKSHPAFAGAATVALVLQWALAIVHYALQLVLLASVQAAAYRRLAGNVGDDVALVF